MKYQCIFVVELLFMGNAGTERRGKVQVVWGPEVSGLQASMRRC